MPSSTTSSEPARVLLVDDNEAMLARAAAVLTPGCLVVGAAKDGQAALEAARTLQPDVIVLDISMPGMTGLEVACASSRRRFDGGVGVSHRSRRGRLRLGGQSRRGNRLRREAAACLRPEIRRARKPSLGVCSSRRSSDSAAVVIEAAQDLVRLGDLPGERAEHGDGDRHEERSGIPVPDTSLALSSDRTRALISSTSNGFVRQSLPPTSKP